MPNVKAPCPRSLFALCVLLYARELVGGKPCAISSWYGELRDRPLSLLDFICRRDLVAHSFCCNVFSLTLRFMFRNGCRMHSSGGYNVFRTRLSGEKRFMVGGLTPKHRTRVQFWVCEREGGNRRTPLGAINTINIYIVRKCKMDRASTHMLHCFGTAIPHVQFVAHYLS